VAGRRRCIAATNRHRHVDGQTLIILLINAAQPFSDFGCVTIDDLGAFRALGED